MKLESLSSVNTDVLKKEEMGNVYGGAVHSEDNPSSRTDSTVTTDIIWYRDTVYLDDSTSNDRIGSRIVRRLY